MPNVKTAKLCGLLAAVLLATSAAKGAQTTYVDVDCSDDHRSNDKIDAAIARATDLRQSDQSATVVIRLSSGICRLDRPMILSRSNSGLPSRPFLIEGSQDGSTIVTGAFPMRPAEGRTWSPLLPEQAKKAGVQYLLSARAAAAFAKETPRGAVYPLQPASVMLLEGGRWLHPARWPKAGYAEAVADPRKKGPVVWPNFRVPDDKKRAWSLERELWLGGYWTYDWVYETLKVGAVDSSTGVVSTSAPLKTKYDEAAKLNYFVFNASSELTEPGEYVLDSRQGIATVWNYPDTEPQSVEAYSLVQVRDAHDIQIDHIQFRGALDTAIVIANSDRIAIKNCLVRGVGKTAIRIEAGQDDTIARTVIADIGETAVVIQGGDRATLKPSGHALVDSIVARYGTLTRTYRPAVSMSGVAVRVQGSLFEDSSFGAIMFEGNDHIIRENEFAHVVREAGDAGTIYAGRNVSWRGNQIERNFFHDIAPDIGPGRSPRGVYLDDFVSGNEVKENVFYNVTSPVYIHGGSDTNITRNFFACVKPNAFFFHSDPNAWNRQGLGQQMVEAARRAGIPLSSLELYRKRYPGLDRALSPEGYIARNNKTLGNIVAGRGDFAVLGNIEEPFDAPDRISALSCAVAPSERAGYLANAIAPFGLTLADRRTALRDLPYFREAELRSN